MEEEEILQFIANAQKQGKSEQSIRRSLRVRGVVDSDQYLKKKDDTSTSASASGEAGTESQQVTAPQGGQELGSSVSPLAPQPESNIATQLTGLSDPQVDPISGEVAPWTDTPANRARLEIDPVHYDAFQKSGFVRAMEGVGSQYVTPEVTGIFNDFVTANDWWWNAVDSNVEKVSKELAKNDLYLQENGIEYKN